MTAAGTRVFQCLLHYALIICIFAVGFSNPRGLGGGSGGQHEARQAVSGPSGDLLANGSCSLSLSDLDRQYMNIAIDLARRAVGRTRPNPAVGCVLLDSAGELAGSGFHERSGEPHAEVFALKEAEDRARGGTAYVSLEPCNHYGRTPPCTQALLKSGIRRVVVGMVDPDVRVSGSGLQLLRESGVDVVVCCGDEAARCQQLNQAYVYRVLHQKPHLTLWDGILKHFSDAEYVRKALCHCADDIDTVLCAADSLKVIASDLSSALRLIDSALPAHVNVVLGTFDPMVCTESGRSGAMAKGWMWRWRISEDRLLQQLRNAIPRDSTRVWHFLRFHASPGESGGATEGIVLSARSLIEGKGRSDELLGPFLSAVSSILRSNALLILSTDTQYTKHLLSASSPLVQRLLVSFTSASDPSASPASLQVCDQESCTEGIGSPLYEDETFSRYERMAQLIETRWATLLDWHGEGLDLAQTLLASEPAGNMHDHMLLGNAATTLCVDLWTQPPLIPNAKT